MAYFELSDVNKYFRKSDGKQVLGLDQINLSLEKGQVLGIIGTNGAGKSTLLNSIAGSLAIDQGTIQIDGQEVSQWGPQKRAKLIGRVFQNPSHGTAPRMTVFENLVLAQKRGQRRLFNFSLTEANRQALAEELKSFGLGLEDKLDLPMESLSGGQRQVASLIMATLNRSKLLLLDEHTAALDPRMARQVMEDSRRLIQEKRLTTLMITHHLQDALDFSDKIAIMHQARIEHVFDGDEIQQLTAAELMDYLNQLSYQVG